MSEPRQSLLSPRQQLEAFLQDVSSLAIRLRTTGTTDPHADQLPGPTLAVLDLLKREGPVTVPGIARARRTSRQNIQVIVNRLRQEGLVRLGENPAHKRSELVFLADQGAAKLDSVSQDRDQFLDQLLGKVTVEALLSASEVISRLQEAIVGAQPKREAPKLPKREKAAPVAEELPISLL
jgi:DNA-binding MarR family transcriptional regulator